MRMEASHSLYRQLATLVLSLLPLLVVSCGTLEVTIERTATPDQMATSTMAAVATQNARLATQVATLSIAPTPTPALGLQEEEGPTMTLAPPPPGLVYWDPVLNLMR